MRIYSVVWQRHHRARLSERRRCRDCTLRLDRDGARCRKCNDRHNAMYREKRSANG